MKTVHPYVRHIVFVTVTVTSIHLSESSVIARLEEPGLLRETPRKER
jgi:hypothetical protein